ncbi:MAG: Sirohydrochlorin cobaltochelatase [Chroococcopsis gigantea SAG 12.99]|jgi:sirohydrochlorin cobaltochelatase|nr:sirohydrochlorin chelatase [Chlorogloea purpurea SAG 13.99]MDV3000410.1 Sirohydrochlorin cobaltochelatase [Chroococcopsis gigantea SAG 12.99]
MSLQSQTLDALQLPSLPYQRPLLLIGHGTRDDEGRQTFLDFAEVYQKLDTSRPVIPCFLELTAPTILEGVETCIQQGYRDISALPLLLFAARHNKFDVTNELDRTRLLYPNLQFHYGRHLGITPPLIDLWRKRLAQLDGPEHNPDEIERADTILLFVGRGSSDPDANGDLCKLARIMWEGSGYGSVETCFIGITHPRLEDGFRRAYLHGPKRIIVLPYFLFTGALVKKIYSITEAQQQQYRHIAMVNLPEMGITPEIVQIVREREIETHLGQVQMNCEMCKFRLAAKTGNDHHHHGHDHSHGHHHGGSHETIDPYANLENYHDRIWQIP